MNVLVTFYVNLYLDVTLEVRSIQIVLHNTIKKQLFLPSKRRSNRMSRTRKIIDVHIQNTIYLIKNISCDAHSLFTNRTDSRCTNCTPDGQRWYFYVVEISNILLIVVI